MADDAPKPPSARDWAKADTVTATPAAREPDEVSDGSGLGFAPARLTAPAEPLDPADPAVRALIAQLDYAERGPKATLPWRGETRSAAELAARLAGWRELSDDGDARLFGRGVPPRLITVAVKRERRDRWGVAAVSPGRQLRASRAGVRASSFRVDPDRAPGPDDARLSLLVTEQTRAGGRLAFGRISAPEACFDTETILLRVFVTPLTGWQTATRPWETPVHVELPEPVGDRAIVDGAIWFAGIPRTDTRSGRKAASEPPG